MRVLSFASFLATALAVLPASAQDRITVGEILPVLAGTELGAIEVADAPPPGGTRVVRRDEVRAALEAAGRTVEGLDIPSRTRIERAGETLEPEGIEALARDEVEAALAPCTVTSFLVRVGATVPAGEHTVELDAPSRIDSGALALSLRIVTGGLTTRVSAQADVTCPEPVVAPGDVLTVRVRSGAVSIVAHGTAREEGRVGDRVRVRVEETGALVEGTVLDARTVEVVP